MRNAAVAGACSPGRRKHPRSNTTLSPFQSDAMSPAKLAALCVALGGPRRFDCGQVGRANGCLPHNQQ